MNEVNALLSKKENYLIRHRTFIAAVYLGSPLVLSFSLVDFLVKPNLFYEYLMARLFVVPVCIITYFLLHGSSKLTNFYTFPAHFFTLFLGLYNSYLVILDGGFSSSYYAGLNLTLVGAIALLPYRTIDILISIATIIGPYYIMCIFFGPLNVNALIGNSAFIVSSMFIAIMANYLTRSLRKSEILHEIELTKLVSSQALEIEVKTKESVNLRKLTMQFSPQIIEAIQSGQIDLKRKLRKLSCIIFIDIVDSSKRSVSIDHQDFSDVVAVFFKNVTDIFLKNNVTVGTFLGDGILGFTNAPINDSLYKKNIVKAAKEVLAYREISQQLIKAKWKKDFDIRIGIAHGHAVYGFFPSEKNGFYTGIGEMVNFAARLCGAATRNTICVEKQFLIELFSEDDSLKKEFTLEHKTMSLKGFEEREC